VSSVFKLVAALILGALACANAQSIPKGYMIAKSSASPHGRYAVIVPITACHDLEHLGFDYLFDLKFGKKLAELEGIPGADRHLNFNEVMPSRWSADSSLLLWHVAGKWFPDAYILVRIKNGNVLWQVDLLKAAQKAILARTKAAAPEKYAATKKAHEGGWGSAYPEGFTVFIKTSPAPLSLPLHIQAALVADPKSGPVLGLDSSMEALVDTDGKFVVTSFSLDTEDTIDPGDWAE
jgi:hypothetical protein